MAGIGKSLEKVEELQDTDSEEKPAFNFIVIPTPNSIATN
jgi:hypothetical protein